MNAPTPALVARPERLRLVGQRRQILAVMHQRLMFGMLVYGGDHRDHRPAADLSRGVRRPCRAARAALINLTPERGDIVDRDGQALARTIDAWTIGLQPAKVIGNKLDLAREAGRADAGKGRGGLSRRCCGRAAASIISAAARRRGLVAAINALGEPGMALEREPDRLYPQTSLAAHVVGFSSAVSSPDQAKWQATKCCPGRPISASAAALVPRRLVAPMGSAFGSGNRRAARSDWECPRAIG